MLGIYANEASLVTQSQSVFMCLRVSAGFMEGATEYFDKVPQAYVMTNDDIICQCSINCGGSERCFLFLSSNGSIETSYDCF